MRAIHGTNSGLLIMCKEQFQTCARACLYAQAHPPTHRHTHKHTHICTHMQGEEWRRLLVPGVYGATHHIEAFLLKWRYSVLQVN